MLFSDHGTFAIALAVKVVAVPVGIQLSTIRVPFPLHLRTSRLLFPQSLSALVPLVHPLRRRRRGGGGGPAASPSSRRILLLGSTTAGKRIPLLDHLRVSLFNHQPPQEVFYDE